jgi:hypothetical protein
MQGAFPGGADWSAALDPGPDDAAQIQQRSDLIDKELVELTRLRDGAAVPPAAPDPFRDYTTVTAPSAHFQLDGQTYYILKDQGLQTARPGALGHYLVTTVDYSPAGGPRCARPLLNAVPLAPITRTPPGAPGTTAGDNRLPPSPLYCMPFVHYICPGQPPSYCEIGLLTLQASLEQAEALDLAFARRMEGLGNVTAQACWDCLDPDYDPSDRQAVLDQFMDKYLSRFYSGIDPESGPPADLVSDEALHKHKAFCQAWAKKHYKTLTPAVTAPAEALASEFFPYIEPWFHPAARLTPAELARVLMRHEATSTEFASCLHYYGTSLEQARGGRNASYKQMSTVAAYRAASHKRFGDLLGAKMVQLQALFRHFGDSVHNRRFDQLLVDWHAILGQMPHVHRFFQNSGLVQGLLKRARRNGADAAHAPPWRTMRP